MAQEKFQNACSNSNFNTFPRNSHTIFSSGTMCMHQLCSFPFLVPHCTDQLNADQALSLSHSNTHTHTHTYTDVHTHPTYASFLPSAAFYLFFSHILANYLKQNCFSTFFSLSHFSIIGYQKPNLITGDKLRCTANLHYSQGKKYFATLSLKILKVT